MLVANILYHYIPLVNHIGVIATAFNTYLSLDTDTDTTHWSCALLQLNAIMNVGVDLF